MSQNLLCCEHGSLAAVGAVELVLIVFQFIDGPAVLLIAGGEVAEFVAVHSPGSGFTAVPRSRPVRFIEPTPSGTIGCNGMDLMIRQGLDNLVTFQLLPHVVGKHGQ